MKGIILCAVLLAACFFLEAKGDCHIDGKDRAVGDHYINCIHYTCHKDGHITALACAVYACKEEIGYRPMDASKPWPECCGGPICKE